MKYFWAAILLWLSAASISYSQSQPSRDTSDTREYAQQRQIDNAVPMSRDWKRTRTPNFIAVSNAPANYVKTILEQLEIFRSSLATGFLTRKGLASDPVIVVVFNDEGSFSRFKPRDEKGKRRDIVSGYFLNGPDMNFIVLPRSHKFSSLQVIFHEYYHYLVHRNIRDLPPWLSEGLAEFYSTSECDPEKGQNLIGKAIMPRIQQFRMDRPLPLEEIVIRERAMKIVFGKDSRRLSMFYAQSWLLVHYLMLSENGTGSRKIVNYLRALEQGTPTEKAFQAAFGATFEKMQLELQSYGNGQTLPAMRITRSPESILRESASEPLTEVEAEYLQGDLLLRAGALEDAERMLAKVLTREPSHISAQISLAQVRTAQERSQEALEMLRPIIASNPENFRAHYGFAEASLQTDQFEDAARGFKRAADINRLAVPALVGEGHAAVALGRLSDANDAMSRVQKLDPDPRWYSVRAYEGFKRGNFSMVLQDVHAYIEQAGRGSESAPYAAFLGAICYLRLQKPAEAENLLREVSSEISEGSWSATVMSFMQGKLMSEQFLDRANDVYERTEAHTYVGMMALVSDKRDEALKHLRWVKERGSKNYVEYGMAVAELKRLETQDPKATSKNLQ